MRRGSGGAALRRRGAGCGIAAFLLPGKGGALGLVGLLLLKEGMGNGSVVFMLCLLRRGVKCWGRHLRGWTAWPEHWQRMGTRLRDCLAAGLLTVGISHQSVRCLTVGFLTGLPCACQLDFSVGCQTQIRQSSLVKVAGHMCLPVSLCAICPRMIQHSIFGPNPCRQQTRMMCFLRPKWMP